MSIWDHMKPASAPAAPTGVELEPPRHLRVEWPDGRTDRIEFRTLRLNCPCAGCVDEWTHQRTLRPETVPLDVGLLELKPMGNYAVQLGFSDGHQSGIFTWALLRTLGAKPVPASA